MDRLRGEGGPDAPCLYLPISIACKPLSIGHNNGPANYELTMIRAELLATDKQLKIAETSQLLSNRIFYANDVFVNLSFILNETVIQKIEKHRKGNLPVKLVIQLQAGMLETLGITKGEQVEEQHFVTRMETGYGDVSFIIEQSMWVNNILPQLGNDLYTLVEIPAVNQVIPVEYASSMAEFEQARKYFVNGDYDKTVAHCRAALDPFKRKPQMEALKNFITSKSEFDWANEVLEATDVWLDKVLKATFSFTSKAHHAPSVGHFGRRDAQVVLMITTGIIAYIGKIGFKPA